MIDKDSFVFCDIVAISFESIEDKVYWKLLIFYFASKGFYGLIKTGKFVRFRPIFPVLSLISYLQRARLRNYFILSVSYLDHFSLSTFKLNMLIFVIRALDTRSFPNNIKVFDWFLGIFIEFHTKLIWFHVSLFWEALK